MNRPCNTLGLAYTSGLCQPHRTCSINEDSGLSLAYTITHELGHKYMFNKLSFKLYNKKVILNKV